MASFSVPFSKSCSSSSSSLSRRGLASQQNQPEPRQFRISYNLHLNSGPLGFQQHGQRNSALQKVHAQPKEVAAEKSLNSPSLLETVASPQGKDEPVEKIPVQDTIPDASSVSAFMAQVADIVKLVDSRDIMELQLKQQDCELIIRKKEALQPPPAAPAVMVPHSALPSQPPPAQAMAPPPASPAASAPPLALPSPVKKNKSSHPPLKCPMAGTFYRASAPGESPFVKVGDKIQKGQVICIIEAMKLMNEIEADQSGTITEILAEDGKPVSVDTPLLVITP